MPNFFLIACAISSGLLSSCTTPDRSIVEASALSILDSRKEASLGTWSKKTIGPQKAREFAENRTSPLIAGQAVITFEEVTVDDESNTITGQINVKGSEKSDLSFSTASAITNDGYYLTAAHCVQEKPIYLFAGNPSGPQKVKARTVWSGPADDASKPDLALIHAPIKPVYFFELASPDEAATGTRVITAGYGGLHPNQAGGKVMRRSPWKTLEGGIRWREIYHNAPIVQGDSGGPLVNARGKLLGINSEVGFGFAQVLGRDVMHSYRCVAICPDPEWIKALIAQDRAQRGG